jgi:murein DD-endopeptidase MepM/ murein hydrolase activator NlpD
MDGLQPALAPARSARVEPAPSASDAPAAPATEPMASREPGDSTDDRLDALFRPPADLGSAPVASDVASLAARRLAFPVPGFDLSRLVDDFADRRGDRVHEAIDIPAGRGTPVVAVDDGTVQKLFVSRAGGNTVYQFDPTRTYAYYYAHLDAYEPGLAEGQRVKKGDRLGTVGTSGNSPPDRPHLHFTVFKLGPEKRWWEGTPINPFPLWALKR